MEDDAEGNQEQRAQLRHLTKTDPDPRVRRRAQALLLVAEGQSQASAARLLQTSAYRVHVWRERFAADGRAGLVDRPRGGRPHTLSAADRAFLDEALAQGPQSYDVPSTIWSIRDLQALLQRERCSSASAGSRRASTRCIGRCRPWATAIAARAMT